MSSSLRLRSVGSLVSAVWLEGGSSVTHSLTGAQGRPSEGMKTEYKGEINLCLGHVSLIL